MLVAAVALLPLLGCGPNGDILADPTDVPGAAATAARRAATVIPRRESTPTPVVVPTPRPRPSPTSPFSDAERQAQAVSVISSALQAKDATLLRPLLLDQVTLAPGGDQGADTLDREAALAWLQDRIGSGPAVVSQNLVENFGLLEVQTAPWDVKAPVATGTIVFNLHRYDAAGKQDPINGDWKIDVLIPK